MLQRSVQSIAALGLSEKHKFYHIHFWFVWAGSSGIVGTSSFTASKKLYKRNI